MPTPRTPKLIIDQAIRENRTPELLCYGYATFFVASGIFTLIWGAVAGNGVVSVAGVISSVFFYPALAAARSIREDDMAIRLLEIALDKPAPPTTRPWH
jgi:hypothetical protein